VLAGEKGREMAKVIDETQVRHVAKLARLELSDAEVGLFSEQLSEIVDYVDKLNELETDNVEPLAHCLDVRNVFRRDEVKESLGTEAALANAPERSGDFFKVPKILDDSWAS